MSRSLMIGCFGYDHQQWVPDPYPEELPVSWRFCYYSNEVRSVVLPASVLAQLDDAMAQIWSEDSDDAFRFVLELTPQLLGSAPQDAVSILLRRLASLTDKLAGALVREAITVDWAEAVQAALGQRIDLCSRDMVASGRVWYPQHDPHPDPCAGAMLALMEQATPKQMRNVIERLAEQDAECGLFFQDPDTAWRQVQQAQQLADLMGIPRS